MALGLLVAPLLGQSAAQMVFPATPATLGAIPDSEGECTVDGAPLFVAVPAAGLVGGLTNVSVSMTISHTWMGEVSVVLISPDGTEHVIFGRTLANAPPGWGTDSDLNGNYTFNDAAAGNWWTAAASSPVAPGSYRTSEIGGPPTATGAITAMNPAYTGREGNGTWYVRFTDSCPLDFGAVSALSLTLTTSGLITVVPIQPPTQFRVDRVVGNLVTLRWDPPAVGPRATGYVVSGGVAPGLAQGSVATGVTPTITFTAPTGAFFVRVVALDGAMASGASNEAPLYVNVPVAPSAPGSLTGVVNGDSLGMSWKLSYGGGEPTSVVLAVSGPVSASVPLGLAESFSFTGVPPGTYSLAVRAVNATGTSAASAPVTLTFPGSCSGAPAAPRNYLFYRVGNTVNLLWDPPAIGPSATAYVLDVTGAYVGQVPVGATRSLSQAVPPGTYTVSVTALNACGASAPTAAVSVTVP